MLQEGGEMGAPAGAPAGPDIEGMLQEFAQTQDLELAGVICNLIIEAMGGGAPEAAPAPEMMRNGGKFGANTPVFTNNGTLIG